MTILTEAHKQLAELSVKLRLEGSPQQNIQLSIVIPSYNEQARLPNTLLETIAWCSKKSMSYELIVVDDGSTDNTLALAKLFAERVKELRYIACPHLGKGAAVRIGMLNAWGEYVLFMDADGATPLDEISKLLTKLQEEELDMVIGSRVVQHPDETNVATSLHRKLLGRVFAALVNIFAVSEFADTQCGFKIFRHEVVHDIFSRQKLTGFAFDVEILYIAKKLGLAVAEAPVNWENQEGSKVNIITDSIKMLVDILRIRWLHFSDFSHAV